VGLLQSLYCGNTASDQIVQITRQSLRLIDAGTQQLAQEWRPPDGLAINVAAASPTQASLQAGIPSLSLRHSTPSCHIM
jgi:Mono-functional DNA-alkylating methyl methanesulfonate N-term